MTTLLRVSNGQRMIQTATNDGRWKMQASETKIRQLVEGTKQYVVPLFQRPYSWSEKQWKVLWNDVHEKSRQVDGRPHFFGSIVTTPARSVPQGVGKFLLIDGQQRITTVQVFLAALRDAATRLDDAKLRDRIDGQYLTNAYEDADERLKVLPTQDDRAAFRTIMWKQDIPDSRLRGCYQFFSSKLGRLPADELERIHQAIVDRLSVVSITCDEHDNPHLIFESLNAKGEKLTPGDLIRNFLLMRVHVGSQSRLFESYWLPIQSALGVGLTEFVRHYLMKEGKILKEADVYFELKDRLSSASPAEAESFLRDLHRHGMFYASFVDPIAVADVEVAERLDRLHRLKFTVSYPFLLRVFDAFDSGSLTREQLIETLDILESFLIRRSICNVQTNQLRRMLPPVFDAAGGAGPGFIEGLRRQLGGRRCPSDEAFSAALQTETLYSTAEKNMRLRLILERLERSHNHKEPAAFSGTQIEHVMPQTLTPAWADELGEDDPKEAHAQALHTLGNLTLTNYNSELSNRPYAAKRQALRDSHFVLNRYFAEVECWTIQAIRDRGRALAERAVGIWKDVTPKSDPSEAGKPVASPPTRIRFRDVEEPVSNWNDAFIKLVQHFERNNPGLLHRIATDGSLYGFISLDKSRFRRSKTQIGDVYVNKHASAAQLQDWCRRLATLGGYEADEYEFVMPDSPSVA